MRRLSGFLDRGNWHERHHPRWRLGLSPLPDHHRHQQAADVGLQQAADLLPAVGADACRYPRDPGRDHARGPGIASFACSATAAASASSFSYAAQPKPEGLAQAFIIGRQFVGRGRCALVLGDNIFYGTGLTPMLQRAIGARHGLHRIRLSRHRPGALRRCRVRRERASLSASRRNPKEPKSHWAVTGLYFYDNHVLDIAAQPASLRRGASSKSPTSILPISLRATSIDERMGRGFAWLDTGTPDSILDAAEFVRTIEQRQGWMIACIEEIAYRSGFIDAEQLLKIASSLKNTYYGPLSRDRRPRGAAPILSDESFISPTPFLPLEVIANAETVFRNRNPSIRGAEAHAGPRRPHRRALDRPRELPCDAALSRRRRRHDGARLRP